MAKNLQQFNSQQLSISVGKKIELANAEKLDQDLLCCTLVDILKLQWFVFI